MSSTQQIRRAARWFASLAIGVTAAEAIAFQEQPPRGRENDAASTVVTRDGREIPTEITPPARPRRALRAVTAPVPQPAARAALQTQDAESAPTDDAVEGAPEADAPAADDGPYPRPRYGGIHPRYARDHRYRDYPRYRRHYASRYSHYRYGVVRDAYEAGRVDERDDARRRFNEDDTDRRRDRTLTAHAEALERGLAQLAAGEYREAAAALTLAARLDQSDPACRVHLAQARMAIGQFDDAGRVLRRGLELQPELALLPLSLEKHYPATTDFDAHVRALEAAVAEKTVGDDAAFLLGFMEYQRGHSDAAHQHFARLASGAKRDSVLRELLTVTKPAAR